MSNLSFRDIAQFGSALRSGRRGRRFKSCYPDHVRASFISLALIFYIKIRVRSYRCSSFFVKRHAQLSCSVVNALTTAHNRYHLFTILRAFGTLKPLILLHFRISPVRTCAPRRNGLCSVPIFLCRKISHALRHSSSFVKSHAQFACSFVNALATAHNRYRLFTILRTPCAQKLLILLRFRISPVRTRFGEFILINT